MKKILGIVAALALCAATARASSLTTSTGPPDANIGVQVSPANNASVAGDIGLWFGNIALSMGDETSQDEVGLIHNAASNESSFAYTVPSIGATEVDNPANAGKMDGMAALLGATTAAVPASTCAWVTHGAPPANIAEVAGYNA